MEHTSPNATDVTGVTISVEWTDLEVPLHVLVGAAAVTLLTQLAAEQVLVQRRHCLLTQAVGADEAEDCERQAGAGVIDAHVRVVDVVSLQL